MMSVIRIPNFSFTTTTSPRAISFWLTKISSGSPASLVSSMTDPCPSCRRSLISILVLPSSTETSRGMSRMKSRFATLRRGRGFLLHSCAPFFFLRVSGFFLIHRNLLPVFFKRREFCLQSEKPCCPVDAAFAKKFWNALDVGQQGLGDLFPQGENIPDLKVQELLDGDLAPPNSTDHFHLGAFEALQKPLNPALVDFQLVALEPGVEFGLDGFDGGVGDAEGDHPGELIQLQPEGNGDDQVAGGND